MVLLFIEIGLAVKAWRNGWKAWALLPLASQVALGLFAGVVVAASGASGDQSVGLAAVGLLIDLLGVGVTGWMASRTRENAIDPSKPEAPREEQAPRNLPLPLA